MDNEKIIILTVLAGSLFAFSLIVVIILFVVVYQRKSIQREKEHSLTLKNKELELLKAVIETQESEKQKIAANLHDEINPLLATIKLGITGQQRILEKQGVNTEAFVSQKNMINTVIENLQSATRDLSPRILYKYGLVEAMRNFLVSITEFTINFESEIDDNVQLSDTIKLNIYRIFLELIQNIRKHENAKEVHIKIEKRDNIVVLTIKHDGKGFSNAEFDTMADESIGLGLNSMKSRCIVIGATLDFVNSTGSEIILKVPLLNAEEN